MRRIGSVLVGFFAIHCGTSDMVTPDPDAGLPAEDAAVIPAVDAGPEPCTLTPPSAETLRTSEGGKLSIPLSTNRAATIAVAHAPDGFVASIDGALLSVKVPYGSAGQPAITLAITCDASPVLVDVALEIRALSWSNLSTWTDNSPDGPPSREHPLMWIDEADPSRLLVFGGYGFEPRQYTLIYDLWEFDLDTNTWSSIAMRSDPPHRGGGRMALIPGQRALLFAGGDDESQAVQTSSYRFDYAPDVLEWSNEATSTATLTAPPPGAILHSLVYDARHDRFVSACGWTGQDTTCDVTAHHLDTGGWETLAVDTSGGMPSPRYGFAYAYDPETERVILASGAQYPVSRTDPVNAAEDTWALELSEDPPRWSFVGGPQNPSIKRRNGCWALDPVGHRFFVWGGTPDARTSVQGLFVLDLDRGLEAWTRVEIANPAPVRSSCAGVYDAARKQVIFGFGNDTGAIYTDLWALQL